MKKFTEYIFELNRPYEFRVKICSIEPKGEVMDRIRRALDTFQLESVGSVRSLPIQEHREFPQWGPCECWQFDVKVAYPTNTVQIRQVIKERAQVQPDYIYVRNLNEAEFTEHAESVGQDHDGALLDDIELKDEPGAQELVGQSRVDNFMKNHKSRQYDVQGKDRTDGKTVVTTGKTTNELPMGNVSAMGTTRNKIPNPMKKAAK
jgi:hypothetical protein